MSIRSNSKSKFSWIKKTCNIQPIKLKPVAPYNFELNARIFTGGDPQISGYDNGKFWQVIKCKQYIKSYYCKINRNG
jgi:hypothetical protein